MDHPGEYRGKEIRMEKNDGKISHAVTQKKSMDNLSAGRIPVGRLQKLLHQYVSPRIAVPDSRLFLEANST